MKLIEIIDKVIITATIISMCVALLFILIFGGIALKRDAELRKEAKYYIGYCKHDYYVASDDDMWTDENGIFWFRDVKGNEYGCLNKSEFRISTLNKGE